MDLKEWFDSGTDKKYHFDELGSFVDSNGKPPSKGFKLSNEFSDWINSSVVNRMQLEGLIKTEIPKGSGAPIFHTPDAFNNPKKLLVLLQGTGRVRAGVWSIGLCAYSGLYAGSALSGIREAVDRGIEIVVLNPNDERNAIFAERFNTNIGMVRHTLACFEDLIIPGNPERVFIIAHSMGGQCAISVMKRFPQWTVNHIAAVAMTDACESSVSVKGMDMKRWCFDNCINWVCSGEKLNATLQTRFASKHRSAGTKDHPRSTANAWPFIWEFFDDKGANKNENEPFDIEKYYGKEKKHFCSIA